MTTRKQSFGINAEAEQSSPKKARIEDTYSEPMSVDSPPQNTLVYSEPGQLDHAAWRNETTRQFPTENLLPPSRKLLGGPSDRLEDGVAHHTVEIDVGISEYVSSDITPIHGIIKQRFTDFLVYEINQDNEVVRIKSLEMSRSDVKNQQNESEEVPSTTSNNTAGQLKLPISQVDEPELEEVLPWSPDFDHNLKPFFSEEAINQLKQMVLEGPEPPLVSDKGWAGRREGNPGDAETSDDPPSAAHSRGRGNKGKKGRGRGRGRGGARGRHIGPQGVEVEDKRNAISNPIHSKTSRTELHKLIRDLFKGKLDSETDATSASDKDGSRIVVRWARTGSGRDAGRSNRGGTQGVKRDSFPAYIHFTLQKTNRDTQDALSHLSRMLHVSVKDLSVAGTKDKRGVTVQRVSLKRNGKTVEDVWKLANGQTGRRTMSEILTQRGERGVRVSDLNYRKASLELGMLKGNMFVITLRNVCVESVETLDNALNSIKHKGFINYYGFVLTDYGMQRFGTASIPTHSIGLALLQSDWHKAVSLILRHRPGEHPDVIAARDAWLLEGDLDKALELMPRRVVAERCILESYRKQGGETRNAMGALSTIPRNLRLMYVHAYQSYVWNAIVSERIRMHGAEGPVAGDLVFDVEASPQDEDNNLTADPSEDADASKDFENEDDRKPNKSRKPWEPQSVKTLSVDDVDQYNIFDVIMPLPGKDVAYPGGHLGEKYREFLRLDGLDPDDFTRKQKEYNLSGSYRKIIHRPSELSWSVLRYTDPDVPLAQSDEDKLLDFDPPVIDDAGKFLALQINMKLGTAAYATMALRELTKTETSSHYQIGLTQASADQEYRGSAGGTSEGIDVAIESNVHHD